MNAVTRSMASLMVETEIGEVDFVDDRCCRLAAAMVKMRKRRCFPSFGVCRRGGGAGFTTAAGAVT